MQARRREILDGARRAFSKHGYEGATIARLEDETGLSRGAIFNYYPSKWAIFYALAQDDAATAIEAWLDRGYGAALLRTTELSADWLGVYVEVLRHLRTSPELMAEWKNRAPALEQRLEDHLRELQARGEVRRDVDWERIGEFLGVILDGAAVRASVGVPIDVETTLRLVTAAIAPQ